ncbi:MAG: hypothetical protein ACRC1W_07860 [Shewanella sp.]
MTNYEDVSINGRFFSVPRGSANYQYIGQLEAILEDMRRTGEVNRIFKSYSLEAPIQQAE